MTITHKHYRLKIAAIVIASIVLLLSVAVFYANYVITALVKEKLSEQMVKMDGEQLRYDDINVDLWTRSVFVSNLFYSSCVDTLSSTKPGFEISIEEVAIKYVHVLSIVRNKELNVKKIIIDGLNAKVYTVDKPIKTESQQRKDIETYKTILQYIAMMDVKNVSIKNAAVDAKSITSSFAFSADSINISAHNLCYNLVDSALTYNDSIYEISLKHISFVQPNGEYKITVNSAYTTNADQLEIEGMRHICLIPKTKLAEHRGCVPVIWSDIELDNVETNRFNVIRSVLQGHLDVDSVFIKGGKIDLYKDNRYPPVKVDRPIQTLLMQIKQPFHIRHVSFAVQKFHYAQKEKNAEPGVIGIENMNVRIDQIQNVKKNIIKVHVDGPLNSHGGYLDMHLKLYNDPKCTWNCHTILINSYASAFNSMVLPLFGAELNGQIDRIDSKYEGDSLTAKGIFTMIYHDVEAKIIKGDSPYAKLNKYSNTINGIAKMLIPRANPSQPGKEPKSFVVETQRNLYKPYFLHFITPMFKGVEETLLSEFFLSKQVRTHKVNDKHNIEKQHKNDAISD